MTGYDDIGSDDAADIGDLTPDGVKQLITANNDALDDWNEARGIRTERMDMKDTITRPEAENRNLREIVSKCCNALPNGAFCSPKASLDFMKLVPDEIHAAATGLRAKLETVEAETIERAVKRVKADKDIQGLVKARIFVLLRSLKDKDQQNG